MATIADFQRQTYIDSITSLASAPPAWYSNTDLERMYYLVNLGVFDFTDTRSLSELRAVYFASKTDKEIPGDTNEDMRRKMWLTLRGYTDPINKSTIDLEYEGTIQPG